MIYARITRTVVTALLIVATATQPVSAFALAGSCPADRAPVDSVCPGCGCCDVKEVGERCCCCRGEDNEPAESKSAIRAGGASAELTSLPSSPEITADCHCGIHAPPMNHDGQRHELVRQIVLRVVTEMLSTDKVRPTLPPAVQHFANHSAGSRCDFSQCFLSVWRI